MRIKITIQNYRCFVQPATIEISKGFTAFVGVNNSGKSAAMRFLLELRQMFQHVSLNQEFANSLAEGQFGRGIALLHVTDPEEIFSNLNEGPITFSIEFIFEEHDGPVSVNIPSKVQFVIDRQLRWKTKVSVRNNPLTFNASPAYDTNSLFTRAEAQFDATILFSLTRTLSRTLYVGPFRNTINVGTKQNYFDIQIGEAFIAQFRDLKTGSSKRNSANISNVSENIRRIFGFNSLDIIPSADNTSLHITINDKPYKQHEIGSGIAQFIVVLANVAVTRPAYLLIDEPELNLHPSLQLDFLTTLATYVEEGIWFSTHSLGLARSAAEHVYRFRKIRDGNSTIQILEGTPRLSEFLGEMNFGSYQTLGFDKLLLVEGPTEVKVIQQFLRVLGKEHKVVILPMHGSWPDRTALLEILRITQNVAAIIDSERAAADAQIEQKRIDFLALCEELKVSAHALELRATENYFSDHAVKSVFGESYRGLKPFEKLKDMKPNWSKAMNWKLAAAMRLDEFKDTDFGRFLAAL